MDLTSSEDSDDDGTFTVRSIAWRSNKVSEFFKELDLRHEKKLPNKSRKMTSQRYEGIESNRQQPTEGSVPSWFTNNC